MDETEKEKEKEKLIGRCARDIFVRKAFVPFFVINVNSRVHFVTFFFLSLSLQLFIRFDYRRKKSVHRLLHRVLDIESFEIFFPLTYKWI